MSDIEMRQLAQFVAIAEAGSFRAAAQRVFVAQPALSVAIRKLEDAVGAPLFVRGRRGVTLTPAGQAFLPEARRSLLHAEQARQHARHAALGEGGTVRLGFVGSAAYRLLPQQLPGFLARYPGVQLELVEGTSLTIVPMLREGRLDVGIVRSPLPDADDLLVREVQTDRLVAVLPRSHPLAGRRRIALAALKDESFVMFSRSQVPGLRAVILQACRDAGFSPRITQDATQIQTVVGLVGSGLGVALVPGVAADSGTERVCFVPLDEGSAPAPITVALATRREGLSPAAQRLCAALAGPAGPPPGG